MFAHNDLTVWFVALLFYQGLVDLECFLVLVCEAIKECDKTSLRSTHVFREYSGCFFTTTPPNSSLEIADLKHSNISKGKFQEKFTVHGRKLEVFLFILLTIVGWDKWYLKAFSSSNVCFFTTALDNCKISLPIWLAKAFFSLSDVAIYNLMYFND